MITPAIIALAAVKATEQREQARSRPVDAALPEQEKQGEFDTLLLLLAVSAIIPGGL